MDVHGYEAVKMGQRGTQMGTKKGTRGQAFYNCIRPRSSGG
jgi:hypothetical protein